MYINWNDTFYDTKSTQAMRDLQKELDAIQAIIEHYVQKKQVPVLLKGNYGGTE